MAVSKLKSITNFLGTKARRLDDALIPGVGTLSGQVGKAANTAFTTGLAPIANAQQFIESPASFRAPTIQTRGLLQTAAMFPANAAINVANSVVGGGVLNTASDLARIAQSPFNPKGLPQYNTLKSGAAKLGYQLVSRPNQEFGAAVGVDQSNKALLGDIGQTIAPILDAYSSGKVFGIGKNAVMNTTKMSLPQAVAKGFKGNVIPGALSGLATGLSDNRTTQNNLNYAANVGLNVGTNALAAGVFGGLFSAGGQLTGAARNRLASVIKAYKPELSEKQVNKEIAGYVGRKFMRDSKGRFTLRPANLATEPFTTATGHPSGMGEPTVTWRGQQFNSIADAQSAMDKAMDQALGLDKIDSQGGKINFGEIAEAAKIDRTKLTGKQLTTPNKKLAEEDPFIADLERNKGPRPVFNERVKGTLQDEMNAYTAEEAENAANEAIYNAQTNRKGFDTLFAKLVGESDAAKTSSAQMTKKYSIIPKKEAMEFINTIEGTTNGTKLGKDTRPFIGQFRKETDRLYNEAKQAGVDIGYLKNYITHYWDRPVEEVMDQYQVFKTREGFQNDRQVPTYAEGIAMGLKPKYNHPSQILGEYTKRLERLKATMTFLKEAKNQGYIVDAAVGAKQPGFVAITAPGFPRSVATLGDGKQVIGNYYAPKDFAQTLNRMYGEELTGNTGKVFNVTGKISSKLQDIGLSGGVPGTPLNAFGAANLNRELTTNLVTPWKMPGKVATFIRAFSQNKSMDYLQANAEQIKKLQKRNVPVQSIFDTKNMVDKGFIKNKFGESIADVWNKQMGDPTFGRYLPMNIVSMFNDIERQALKGGNRSAEEAADIAANAVKKFYGVKGTDVSAKETKLGSDILSTVFFAPRYRDSMIRFWGNNIKALRNPLALENRQNVKFITGAAITLAVMNHLNYQLNGKNMWENPEGKEDKLLIPLKDGTVIGVPFLSSIATIPRALFREANLLRKGDVQGATKDAFQSYASMAIKPIADVAANSDYFGKPITEDTDTPSEKFVKQGKYLASQYAGHPYLKEALNPSNQGDPAYQRASRSMELPFRFYDKESIAKGEFYNKYYDLKPFAEKYQELSWKDPDKAQAFLAKNQDKINEFNYMKQVQSAYYDQKERGIDNINTLQVSSLPQGVTRAGDRIIFQDEKGNWTNVDLAFTPKAPKLTGKEELDKKLLSQYKGDLTKKANDITQLYELGIISAEQAESQLAKIESLRPKKPKKGPKLPTIKYTIPKARSVRRRTRTSMLARVRKAKLSEIKAKPLTTK